MEELTQEETNQLIQDIIENGAMQVLEYQAIPGGAERARVTKSRYYLRGQTVEVITSYANDVRSADLYSVKNQSKTLV